MWCVVEYHCFGDINDPTDRPDERVHAIHGPFVTQTSAEKWFEGRTDFKGRQRLGPLQYMRYEAEPLCAP